MSTQAVITDSPALARFQQRALIIGGIGLAAGAIGAVMNFDQFIRSWLIGFLFCLGLTLGSLALLMLQHLSGGQWGLVSRRVFEAATRTLPIVALFFIPILLRLPVIFEWARPEAVDNAIIQAKAGYLNQGFFIVRALLYFAFWMLLMVLLNRWSAEQDSGQATTPADSVRFRTVSAPGLLFLVLTVTFASVDWIMSLDPEWFSTIFGLLTIAGWGLTSFALTIVVLALVDGTKPFARRPQAAAFSRPRQAAPRVHDAVGLSQLLAVPDHLVGQPAGRDSRGTSGGSAASWGYVAIALVVGHFGLPVPAAPVAGPQEAGAACCAQGRDVHHRDAAASTSSGSCRRSSGRSGFHWLDIAVPVGLTGIWLFVFTRNLRSRAMLPVNDPYFKEAFAHEAH